MSNTRIISKADAEASRAEANRVWNVYIAMRASVKDATEAAARKEELTASYDAAVAARDRARELESMIGQSVMVPTAPAPAPVATPAPVSVAAPAPSPAPAPAPAPVAAPAPAPKKPAPPAPKAAPIKPAPADDSFEDDLVEPPAK